MRKKGLCNIISHVILFCFSGETEPNRLLLVQGQGGSNAPLSDVGLHQAELVANRLTSEVGEFEMVFSSDACRTTQVRLMGGVIIVNILKSTFF